MNYRIFIFTCLLILIVLSKEALVFNEEILVMFAFFLFIFLVFNLVSGSVSGELDNRLNKIKEDFTYYKTIQETTITRLISYHSKQKQLSKEINDIFLILKDCIETFILSCSKFFINLLIISVEDILKKFFSNELKFQVTLQTKLSDELHVFLISKYSKKDKKYSSILLKKSIYFLSSFKS